MVTIGEQNGNYKHLQNADKSMHPVLVCVIKEQVNRDRLHAYSVYSDLVIWLFR